MRDGGPLVLQLAPKPENISKIERTASLALIMKKYRANPGVNRAKNGAATAASVKHKCYSFTIIMYYLNITTNMQSKAAHVVIILRWSLWWPH